MLPHRATGVHNAVVTSTPPLRNPSEVAFDRAFRAMCAAAGELGSAGCLDRPGGFEVGP